MIGEGRFEGPKEARALALGFPPATGDGLGEVEGGRSDIAVGNVFVQVEVEEGGKGCVVALIVSVYQRKMFSAATLKL